MPTPAFPVDYQHVFRSLPGLYLLLAPDGTILDHSEQHVQNALLPREQAVGRNIFEAYPSAPESQQQLAASHEQVRRHRRPDTMPLVRYDLERPAALGGGSEERYWLITHYPILDERGELQYILQLPQDVTSQHLAEQQRQLIARELSETQESARFTLDALPVLVNTTDAEGQPIFFNQRWQVFTGLSTEELLSNWGQVIHPEDRARLSQSWEDTRLQTETTQYEYRVRRADGQYRWVMTRSVPRFDAAGQVVQRVGGGTDIHDQKTMVQELLESIEQQAQLSEQSYQSQQQVQQQRQTFYDLLMHAPAHISIVRGPEHRYEFANEQFRALVGQREVVGRTVAEVFPEIVSQGIVAMLDEVFRSGQSYVGKELLVQLDRGDGQLRDAYFDFIYQRFEENGQPAGITAYSYEVTDLVQTRHTLAQLSHAQGAQGADPAPAVH
jgi:PAS domain S-box-containing protein